MSLLGVRRTCPWPRTLRPRPPRRRRARPRHGRRPAARKRGRPVELRLREACQRSQWKASVACIFQLARAATAFLWSILEYFEIIAGEASGCNNFGARNAHICCNPPIRLCASASPCAYMHYAHPSLHRLPMSLLCVCRSSLATPSPATAATAAKSTAAARSTTRRPNAGSASSCARERPASAVATWQVYMYSSCTG